MGLEVDEALSAVPHGANVFTLKRGFHPRVAVASMTALAAASGMAIHASGGQQSGAHQTTAAPHV